MATIDNTLPISFESEFEIIGAKNMIIMDDNTYHIEKLSDNEITVGQIVFSPLTEAERDTVMTFYTTNKDIAFSYVNPKDGVTYTLYFVDPVPTPTVIQGTSPFHYTIVYNVVGE